MKEQPILMTPDNGQKCFYGVKTQTRRIIEPQPKLIHAWNGEWLSTNQIFRNGEPGLRCPYGVVGDRLWVREACWIWGSWRKKEIGGWSFVEGQRKEVLFDRSSGFSPLRKGDAGFGFVRREGIFMPRWACRTVLEITDVRVERVQMLTPADARAEGCDDDVCAKGAFVELWESINGQGSWDRNEWVWVISFKKVQVQP